MRRRDCFLLFSIQFYLYRKSRIRLLLTGFLSLRKRFCSIWRILSRVTLNSLPTSSSVRGWPSSRPKRRITTCFLTILQIIQQNIDMLAEHDGFYVAFRGYRVAVRNEITQVGIIFLTNGGLKRCGLTAICMISITFSSDISSACASSATDGS